VPHHDGSGVIDAVGEGVTDRFAGQRVWLYLAAAGNRYGTAAEYTVVPTVRTAPLPDNASDELGACLGVPALTAAICLGGHPEALAGAHLLVAGGAGAVGHFAIELAKHAGAHVATTVSSPAKAEMARAAGADLVVNYRQSGAADQLKSFAPRMDRILELALGANLDLDLAVSGPGTLIVVYAAESDDPVVPTRRLMNANVSFRYVLLYGVPAPEVAHAVGWVNGAAATGALSALPLHLYSLDDIAAAQDAVEHGAVGKVVVVPAQVASGHQRAPAPAGDRACRPEPGPAALSQACALTRPGRLHRLCPTFL
jgi:NADPH2:quinone reductase